MDQREEELRIREERVRAREGLMVEREYLMAHKERKVAGQELAAARRAGILFKIKASFQDLELIEDDGAVRTIGVATTKRASDAE